MFIKPPIEQQPQEIYEKAPKIDELPLQAIEIVKNNDEIMVPAPPITNLSNEPHIRKKRQYKAFMKLIKEKKYTTALLTSRHLGVDRSTIQAWLDTKVVRAVMESEYNDYIDKIQVSKDWKAQAYLLDKLEDRDNLKDTTVTLTNLIQVNTTPSQVKQGTVTI